MQLVLFVRVDEPVTLEIQIMGCMEQHMWAAESGKGPPRLRMNCWMSSRNLPWSALARTVNRMGTLPVSFSFNHRFPEFPRGY